MNILVIKFRHIGDVLLSTPLLESLKLTYPTADIDVTVNDYSQDILLHNPHIRKVIPYTRVKGKKLSLWQKIKAEYSFLRQFYNRYDLVVNLTEGDRGCLITAISGAKARLGFVKDKRLLVKMARFTATSPWLEALPTVEKDLRLLEHLHEAKVSKRVLLAISEQEKQQANQLIEKYYLGEKFILIHPVSRGLYKCWHEQKVAKLVDYLMLDKGKKVILTASSDPLEGKMLNEIVAQSMAQPIVAIGELTLPAYRALVDRAACYVGIDSAPTHIAASTQTPTISLFGSSKPDIWGPWDNEQGGGYEVKDGVQVRGKNTLIAKMDLSKYELDGYQHPELRIDIELDDVIAEVDKHLGS